ncbi:MAG TPA: hypothetical protein VGC39_07660 [Candidatus Methylacidiphilales bacterium]
MNDDELRQRLRQLRIPEASESAQGRARHRALIAFEQGGSLTANGGARRGFGWRWAGVAALALILSLLPFFLLKRPAPPENLANDRDVLQQVQKLFPNQVNAVVERNGNVDLSITQDAMVGSDQPVLLVFRKGRESIRVLSYSGHRVCLMLGQTQSCFEILATPTGGVILEGEDKAWLASEHPHVAGYSIRAQTLGAAL